MSKIIIEDVKSHEKTKNEKNIKRLKNNKKTS